MKQFFRSNYQHLIAVALFVIVVLVYFAPQFDGQSVNQGDVTQYIGAANESYWFKDKTGDEQLWSNSMFGGMPTTQTTLIYPGNFLGRAIMNFVNWIPAPAGMVLLHLLCFYIMLLCFKVNRWVAIIGAFAFAFASYEIVILEAGHNSKSLAVAFMAPVIGGFYMAYRHQFWKGIGLSALFMALQVSCNHLQVTYYMGILLVGLGIGEAIRAIRKKELKPFAMASGGLFVAYLLAMAVNYGNISLTNEYAKQTIRGGNDLTKTPTGEIDTKATGGGLDKDYITNWSYGIGESFTLVSPYVKGGETARLGDTPHMELLETMSISASEKRELSDPQRGRPVYWGEQPFTSGPVYVGVVMVFLAFLGLIFLKDPIKWPLFIVGIIALMLSWGKNYMGFTDFWLDNVPGYNKFRTVTIILVLIELIIPLVAVLFLDLLIKNREKLIEGKNKVMMAGAGFFLFLIIVKFAGLGDNYASSAEVEQINNLESNILTSLANQDPKKLLEQGFDVNNQQQVSAYVNQVVEKETTTFNNMKMLRAEIFDSSMNRSLLFTFLSLGVVALLLYTSMHVAIGIGIIGILSVVDLMGVSTNYLSSDQEKWMDAMAKKYPYRPSQVDEQILQAETAANPALKAKIDQAAEKKRAELRGEDYLSHIKQRIIDRERFAVLNANTNYRVLDLSGLFQSARASYYHKSLGGYHGAKLRSIQNMYEYHIANSNNAVFDMLNIKYFMQPDTDPQTGQQYLRLRPNTTALGSAWFVKKLKEVESRDEEIASLGKVFKVDNLGSGQLLVNGEQKKSLEVRGFEEMKYLMGSDTFEIKVNNGTRKGLVDVFVMDTTGQTGNIPGFMLDQDTTDSFNKLVSMEVINEFDPSETVILSKENAEGIDKKEYSGEGSIKLDSYSPMVMKYSSDSDADQFAVFSEIYYDKGWKATIDGKEAKIYNVNYCLRGLELPKGKHKIEFIYDSSSYDRSNTISFALCILVLAFAGFGVWKQRKEDLNTEQTEEASTEA